MSDLLDDLAAAFDDHEEDAPSESTEPLAAETTETEETTEESTTTETAEAAPEVDEEHKAEVEAAKEPEYKTDKAPASWSPSAREGWAKMPDAAKLQVAKREAEVNGVLQNSSNARKAMQQLNNTLAPYKDQMQAAGYKDPFSAIGSLLQTEQMLRNGDTQGKAELIARLVKDFRVDITALDGVLSGQPQQPGVNNQVADLVRREMQPFNAYMSQQQQQRQMAAQQSQQEANNTVAQFGQGKEFLNDVRHDMADMMDMAAKRGQKLTLDQAYDKACAIHPQISQVMSERAAASSLTGQNDAMAGKRAAAGAQLTGTRAGGGNSMEGADLRAQIADAWNS